MSSSLTPLTHWKQSLRANPFTRDRYVLSSSVTDPGDDKVFLDFEPVPSFGESIMCQPLYMEHQGVQLLEQYSRYASSSVDPQSVAFVRQILDIEEIYFCFKNVTDTLSHLQQLRHSNCVATQIHLYSNKLGMVRVKMLLETIRLSNIYNSTFLVSYLGDTTYDYRIQCIHLLKTFLENIVIGYIHDLTVGNQPFVAPHGVREDAYLLERGY